MRRAAGEGVDPLRHSIKYNGSAKNAPIVKTRIGIPMSPTANNEQHGPHHLNVLGWRAAILCCSV